MEEISCTISMTGTCHQNYILAQGCGARRLPKKSPTTEYSTRFSTRSQLIDASLYLVLALHHGQSRGAVITRKVKRAAALYCRELKQEYGLLNLLIITCQFQLYARKPVGHFSEQFRPKFCRTCLKPQQCIAKVSKNY